VLEKEMETIERYQPEFVARYKALAESCQCPACQKAEGDWPQANLYLQNQQRDCLLPGCETVARELLLNPEAFILHVSQVEARGERVLTPWVETLNQQCINLAVNPTLNLESSLYAIGILLSKAQQYVDQGNEDPGLLVSMGEQLATLAEHGVLGEQLSQLPIIEANRLAALKEMGTMRLNLNLPMADKMSMMLKLSELSILQQSRLSERLHELQQTVEDCTVFSEQSHILRNLLIYCLYQNVFPGIGCQNFGTVFQNLARQFFQLKMLSSIWIADHRTLTDEQLVILFSAWFQWAQNNPAVENESNTADFSLLCGLSLL
jgi:lysine-N-methylase